jgi:glycosyltransferase involved in cell wall biosynthesis
MRIGIDARLTHYTRGGISVYIRQLAAHLPALDPANDYVIFHSRKARDSLIMPANARRADCWTPAHHRFERLALGLEALPHRLALLHSPDFIPPRGPFRSAITIHDLTFLRYPQFLAPDSRRYYNDQIQDAVKKADAILADSHATRADVLDLLGAAADKVVTVHLAPDPIFSPQPAEAVAAVLSRLDLPRSYLLFVGTFEPRKNVPGLLQAYALLPPDRPPLILAGNKGWLFDEAEGVVRELHLADQVHFLQDFAAADLPALYGGALALILPSHYEGFGLPVLEAFACGTPVVAADRASLPEIAGGAAALCNPDEPASITDSIQRVLSDAAYRSSLVANGFARLKEFSWEKCARETLAVYRSVLELESGVRVFPPAIL